MEMLLNFYLFFRGLGHRVEKVSIFKGYISEEEKKNKQTARRSQVFLNAIMKIK